MNLYEKIQNSFPIIEKLFSEEELSEFKSTCTDELYNYHWGLGAWIRKNLLYPNDNALYNLFIENNIKHIDDMSSLVIGLFHDYISQKI